MNLFRDTAREEYWYRRGMIEQFRSDSANPSNLDSVAYEMQLEKVLDNAQRQIPNL